MVKNHAAKAELGTYAYLALLNIGVALMLAVLLTSMFKAQQVEAMVADSARSLSLLTVSQDSTPIVSAEPVTGIARRVVVPSVGIDSTVQPGLYSADTRSWAIASNGAFHADTTVPVNNTNGSTLIYGHAEWPIFGRLPEVSEGARATVYTAEGLQFAYLFESKRQIDPSDVSALTSTGSPKLLLLTCSGAFDIYRTLVTFRLVGITQDE